MLVRLLLKWVAFGVFVASSAAFAGAEQPNVLFFIMDDAYADLVNYTPEGAGKNLTPTIDRLVKEGTVFRNQQVPSSVCTPSRFSCLTGLYANRSKVTRNDALCRQSNMTLVSWSAQLTPDVPTLPAKLQQAGYFTGMAGKCHFAWFPGFKMMKRGVSIADPGVKETLNRNYEVCIEGMKKFGFDSIESFYVHGQVHDNPVKELRQHNMDWVVEGSLKMIDQAAASGKPFYLYLATTMPHVPYEDDTSWNADPRVTSYELLEEPCRVLPARSTIPERIKAAGLPFDSKRAMMVALDDALKALMEKLEDNGQLDNTVIFFFNDNGQEGKGTVYEGGVTTPSAIWRKGGFPVGAESKALVSNIDFAPTIMELAGADFAPDMFDGVSLLPLLNGEVSEVRDSAYSEMGFSRAVRKGDWKYIAVRYPENAREIPSVYYEVPEDPTSGERPTFGHMGVRPNDARNAFNMWGMRETAARRYPAYWDADQLYYLPEDPVEQNNLASEPQYAEKLAEMKAELTKHIATIPGTFGELKEK
jgi:arylsulfatase A-like enzyme